MEHKDTFTLKEGSEFIELNKLLKLKSIAQTGGHAKIMISNGEVALNGKIEYQIRKKLKPGDVVKIDDLTLIIEA